jgi:hypothetical protein
MAQSHGCARAERARKTNQKSYSEQCESIFSSVKRTTSYLFTIATLHLDCQYPMLSEDEGLKPGGSPDLEQLILGGCLNTLAKASRKFTSCQQQTSLHPSTTFIHHNQHQNHEQSNTRSSSISCDHSVCKFNHAEHARHLHPWLLHFTASAAYSTGLSPQTTTSFDHRPSVTYSEKRCRAHRICNSHRAEQTRRRRPQLLRFAADASHLPRQPTQARTHIHREPSITGFPRNGCDRHIINQHHDDQSYIGVCPQSFFTAPITSADSSKPQDLTFRQSHATDAHLHAGAASQVS